jgi:REP element-mobilizing transposase RayT
MPDSYVIKDQQGVYFLTFQIVSRLDIFTRKRYRDIVVDAFNYCVATKGLRVHAWCIMSNHVHCILSSATGTLSDTIRDLKRHTAKQILLSVKSEPESRRDWLLQGFRQAASAHVRNKDYATRRSLSTALWVSHLGVVCTSSSRRMASPTPLYSS